MRIIVAGSRHIKDYALVKSELDKYQVDEIISGTCRGVDQLGERYAEEHKIPVTKFKPNWFYGKVAGSIRNKAMAEYAAPDGYLLLIWNGNSRGSANMKKWAETYELEIIEVKHV
jgi:hypothetical protein